MTAKTFLAFAALAAGAMLAGCTGEGPSASTAAPSPATASEIRVSARVYVPAERVPGTVITSGGRVSPDGRAWAHRMEPDGRTVVLTVGSGHVPPHTLHGS